MTESVLIGREDAISSIPRAEWEQDLRSAPEHVAERLTFMTEEHHRVRYFVVQALPRRGKPISLEAISDVSRGGQVGGTYLTLDQICYSTRIVQGALFAFPTDG